MKYYVYAGYYENFISGHKLPKPYTLRDEFKTFDEALDYVWENWEDDDIFFTEDVIDDAIDNGVIDDENWEDYLMEESKKSARKSMKEFNEDINNTAYFDRVAGELHSWYVCYVEDYERKYEYGFKNEKECINWIKKNGFDLDPSMIESKKSTRKPLKEYNYDSHNKSWVSDSVEKVYTNGLGYKNDWCALSLYEDEYENLVNYLLDEKGFILEKKYTKKLGYDVFINEKLDLYVVIINETTYGFFDEKHFIIRFGDELGIETPIEVVEKTLKGILFETFDLTKNDVDLIKSNVDDIILKTKEPIDKKLLDNVLNDELSKYHYPISVEVEKGKDESICIIWVS